MILFKSQIDSFANLKKELQIFKSMLVFSTNSFSLISIPSVFPLILSPVFLSLAKITESYSLLYSNGEC